MSNRVLAVVVTYNPELDALKNLLDALVEQVEGVCVVDNGSNNTKQINTLIENRIETTINVINSEVNQGLGVAHNKGIEWANEHDYSHVLILDQDSVPMPGMTDKLLSAWKTCSKAHKVSAVGAKYLNQENNSESFFIRFGRLKFERHYCCSNSDSGRDGNTVEADFLISSGSLISLKALEDIGNMDEGLFIDHVDTEWFLRAKSKNYKAFGVCDAVMSHGLGEKTHRIKLIRERNVPQHKPFRYYYIFRNSILLYKRGYCSALWKWNDVQRLAMIFIMYGLLCPPRWAHISMMLSGIKDGLLGRTGELK